MESGAFNEFIFAFPGKVVLTFALCPIVAEKSFPEHWKYKMAEFYMLARQSIIYDYV